VESHSKEDLFRSRPIIHDKRAPLQNDGVVGEVVLSLELVAEGEMIRERLGDRRISV
jgi:hypothetical protein